MRIHEDPAELGDAMRSELALLLRSPTSFRETVDSRLIELLEEAEAAIRGARTRHEGPHHDPKPDNGCATISLRPDEAIEMLARVEAEIDARRALVGQEAVSFHALLRQALPEILLLSDEQLRAR